MDMLAAGFQWKVSSDVGVYYLGAVVPHHFKIRIAPSHQQVINIRSIYNSVQTIKQNQTVFFF